MLTPRFKLSQDTDRVYITVHAPYTSIADTEVDVDGNNFLFVSSPYFLRLSLPGRIVEDERSKGEYNADSGDFHLSFAKETQEEVFENLDMITSLLAPRDIPDFNKNLVEELESDIGFFTIQEENASSSNILGFGYGFGNIIHEDFSKVGGEFPQVFALKNPNQVSTNERTMLRIKCENEKFSSDHYLADLYECENFESILNTDSIVELYKNGQEFTNEEINTLKELPNKSYILTEEQLKQIWRGLIDILYAYAYEIRTTLNDTSVESSWTINNLSATLSWFATFDNIKETLIACYRRTLIYPIYRSYELCKKTHNDVIQILKQGKIFVIKCLIHIYNVFNTSQDGCYILNQIFIKDYLVFVQKCKECDFDNLHKEVMDILIEKSDVGLELCELEHAAAIVLMEEERDSVGALTKMTKYMNIGCETDSDDTSDSDDSSSLDTSTSDSSSNSSSTSGSDHYELDK